MCSQYDDPTTYAEHQEEVTMFAKKCRIAVDWCFTHHCEDTVGHELDQQPETKEILPGIRLTITHSPWVRRNLDGAQYPQPRGSQYEG